MNLDAIGPLIKVIHPDTVHFNWNGTEFIGSINVENISDKNVLYKVRSGRLSLTKVRVTVLKRKTSIMACWLAVCNYSFHRVLADCRVMANFVRQTDTMPANYVRS